MNVPKEWDNKVDTFVYGFGGSVANTHGWGPGGFGGASTRVHHHQKCKKKNSAAKA